MKLNKWFWGLFFIVSAIIILLNAAGYFININFLSLIALILLTTVIIKSLVYPNFGGFLIPLAIVGVLFDDELGITKITPWPLLITSILLSIGLEIIFRGKRFNNKHYDKKDSDKEHENFNEVINEIDDEEIDYHINFGSAVKYVNADGLKRAWFSCKVGALKLFFDNTKIKGNSADIFLEVTLGAAELYIPAQWDLIIELNCSLAGVQERNRPKKGGPKVTLKGNVTLAGIEIIYV